MINIMRIHTEFVIKNNTLIYSTTCSWNDIITIDVDCSVYDSKHCDVEH